MGVRYEARPGFELVTQVSGIKPGKLPTKPVLHLGNLRNDSKSLARNVKLVYKAAQSNRWRSSAMFFQVIDNGDI